MIRSENSARWWESYLVRYAIGSVVGALCVYVLLDAIGGDLMSKALMMPSVSSHKLDVLASACTDSNANACVAQLQLYQDLYGFNLPQIILLSIYGLGYCYFASAPGLVAHATRRMLISSIDGQSQKKAWFAGIQFAATFLTGTVLIPLGILFCKGPVCAAWATLISACFLIIWQIALLILEYQQGDAVLTFYEQLHRARQYSKISLDSYRHLREHGNAFFIVVLELIFLAVTLSVINLFGAHSYWPAFLVLWIVPGSMVYFIGQKIEERMVNRYGQKITP